MTPQKNGLGLRKKLFIRWWEVRQPTIRVARSMWYSKYASVDLRRVPYILSYSKLPHSLVKLLLGRWWLLKKEGVSNLPPPSPTAHTLP